MSFEQNILLLGGPGSGLVQLEKSLQRSIPQDPFTPFRLEMVVDKFNEKPIGTEHASAEQSAPGTVSPIKVLIDREGLHPPTLERWNHTFQNQSVSVVLLLAPQWLALMDQYANALFSAKTDLLPEEYVTQQMTGDQWKYDQIAQLWLERVPVGHLHIVAATRANRPADVAKRLSGSLGLTGLTPPPGSKSAPDKVPWDIGTLVMAHAIGVRNMTRRQRKALADALELWQAARFETIRPCDNDLQTLLRDQFFETNQRLEDLVDQPVAERLTAPASSRGVRVMAKDSAAFLRDDLEPLISALSTELALARQLRDWDPGTEAENLELRRQELDEMQHRIEQEEAELHHPVGFIKRLLQL